MSDHEDVIPPSPQHREQEAMQHVLREVHSGRHLSDVMEDSFVTDRVNPGARDAIFDHPELAEAIGADTLAQMRKLMES